MTHWVLLGKKKKRGPYITFWIKILPVVLTFPLSLMDPLPRTMILQPVYCSSSLAVIPRGPSIRPTKLNCESKATVHFLFPVMYVCVCMHACCSFICFSSSDWPSLLQIHLGRKKSILKVHLVELQSNTNGQVITLVNS